MSEKNGVLGIVIPPHKVNDNYKNYQHTLWEDLVPETKKLFLLAGFEEGGIWIPFADYPGTCPSHEHFRKHIYQGTNK